jgi:hypothetical protein
LTNRNICRAYSCVLEIGIFSSHLIWLLRTRKIRAEAAAQGKTFDDILAEHEARGEDFPFAERRKRRDIMTSSDEEAGSSKDSCKTMPLSPPETPVGDEVVTQSWVV